MLCSRTRTTELGGSKNLNLKAIYWAFVELSQEKFGNLSVSAEVGGVNKLVKYWDDCGNKVRNQSILQKL